MITAIAIGGFLAGIFPGIVIGYRKGLREGREEGALTRLRNAPVKPWGGIDSEHREMTSSLP